jgi:signal transduction histidine kinase
MRIDAGLVALAAVLGALFCLDSGHLTVLDGVVGLAACLALLARRRRPVTLAAVLIVSTALSAAVLGATAIAVGAVARHRSGRVTAAVVAVHAAAVTALFALVAAGTRDFVQGTAVVLALDAAAVATGLLARSLRERHRLRVEEARHAERERIAREMHDVLAHRISLLAVHAGALEVRRSAPAEERQAAAVVRQCAYEALEDLRAVIGMLREDAPAEADRPQPALTDLPALIAEARAAGATVTFEGPDDLPAVPDAVGRHVYRVVQEGLTNARKHAPGEPVTVRIAGGDDLVAEITNPVGAGSSALPGAGSGLIGLGERMRLVGGRLEHGRTPDGRFRLVARAPVAWPR